MKGIELERWMMFGLISLLSGPLAAQTLVPDEDYLRRLKASETVQPVGDTPFGEQVNLYTGDLTFSQSDIVLEGTGPAIRLVRDLATRQTSDLHLRRTPNAMGDWTLSIPRLETLINSPRGDFGNASPGYNWTISGATVPTRHRRCTELRRPEYYGTLDDPESAWFGMDLVTEGGRRQQILRRAAINTQYPAMNDGSGQPLVFTGVTLQNWHIGCLAATSNGEVGEAFIAVSPDGVRYHLNYLVGEPALTKYQMDPYGSGVNLRQDRQIGVMYATRVEDRFGNWVDYTYSGNRIASISASDGRAVSITWRADVPVVQQITVMPGTSQARSWQYQYDILDAPHMEGGKDARLTAVVLPDGSRWQFQLSGLGGLPVTHPMTPFCSTRSIAHPGGNMVSTVVHPSGLVGKFTVSGIFHGRSYVPSSCTPVTDRETIPGLFGNFALVRKEFSGPGIATNAWSYAYSPAVSSAARDACATSQTCANTKWVTVTDPDGNLTRYTFSNRWGESEGEVLKEEQYQGMAALLRTEQNTYAVATHGPYPSVVGEVLSGYASNIAKQQTWHPLKARTTTQQGTVFTYSVSAFDVRARPTSVTKSSAPSP